MDENKKYNKLVRDKIPSWLTSQNIPFTSHIADEEEFKERLLDKLDEEVAEFKKDKSIGELADLLEVLETLSKAHGWTLEQLRQEQARKREAKGGFENRIIAQGEYD